MGHFGSESRRRTGENDAHSWNGRTRVDIIVSTDRARDRNRSIWEISVHGIPQEKNECTLKLTHLGREIAT